MLDRRYSPLFLADKWLWKLHRTFTFPILMGNRFMRVYHYSGMQVMAGNLSTGRLQITNVGRSLSVKKGHGELVHRLTTYQTYLSTLFSFQRTCFRD